MQELQYAFWEAGRLLLTFDSDLTEIVFLSLRVTLSAVFIGCLIGFPLGAFLAVARFPGRTVIVIVVNAFMGLPPVVAGLFLYLLLSHLMFHSCLLQLFRLRNLNCRLYKKKLCSGYCKLNESRMR